MSSPEATEAEPPDSPDRPERPGKDLIPVVLVVIASLAVFAYTYKPFASGEFYAHLDTKAQLIPWRCSQSIALNRGELGIWNPYMSRGYPHHAEGQSGVLHPCHLLVYGLLPVEWGLALEMSLYMPFAFVGMFLFLRYGFGCSRLPSVVGACVLTFSSFMFLHFMHVNMLWVYAHLPWALLALEMAYSSSSPRRWALALGACFVSMILLGHPQLVWMNALAVAGFAAYRAVQLRCSRNFIRRTLLVGAALVGALLIGMVQILPTADFLSRSKRSTISRAEFGNYSLPPVNLALSLNPYMLSNRFVGDYLDSGDFVPSLEFPNYFGAVCISLLLFYCIYDRRRLLDPNSKHTTIVVATLLLVAILLTLGKYGGVVYLQRLLPLVSKFRCPVRYASLVFAALACMVAVAFERLRRIETRNRSDLMWACGIPVGVSLLLTLIIRFAEVGIPEPHVKVGTWLGAAYGPGIAAITVGVLAFAVHKRSSLAWIVLCVLMLFDFACYNGPLLHAMHRRSFAGVRKTRRAMATQDHTYRHYAAINDPVLDGHYIANGYLGITPPEKLIYYGKDMNVTHIRLASIGVGHFVGAKGEPQIMNVPGAIPRARLVPNLKYVAKPLKTQHDPLTTAFTDTRVDELSGPPLELGETAKIIDDGFDCIRIKVVAKHKRLLVLSDRWWPYWQASIDGVAASIAPLYSHSIRGIVVEPGEHVVEMRYVSQPLRRGIWCAIVGIVLLIGIRFAPLTGQSSPKETVSKTS